MAPLADLGMGETSQGGARRTAPQIPAEPSTPLRHAGGPGPGYRRRLRREFLVRELNLFIEAQRAAAWVAARAAQDLAPEDDLKLWALALSEEKSRWCGALGRHVRALGETPSRAVGGLQFQARTLPAPVAKLALLARYEVWLICRVGLVLRRMPIDAVHADLLSMIASLHRSLEEMEQAVRRLGYPEAEDGGLGEGPVRH